MESRRPMLDGLRRLNGRMTDILTSADGGVHLTLMVNVYEIGYGWEGV